MSEREVVSPRINELSWGRMTIDGIGKGKDFKLWPGGGRKWDWTETGTHHVPGIQSVDVEEYAPVSTLTDAFEQSGPSAN